MKKTLLLASFLLGLMTSCSKSEDNCVPGKLEGSCIQGKIETFKQEKRSIAVYSYQVDCEIHYWFHDGSRAWDGSEYIYNDACEEVCQLCGFCVQNICGEKYPSNIDDWTLVWKK